jgi:HAE1 family hydrophobic/amphiphilic exporter-1
MSGLALSTGLIVDNAVIMIETLIDEKKQVACFSSAANRMLPALFASTLTTVVVFIPLILETDSGSELFRGAAIAITASLWASFFLR